MFLRSRSSGLVLGQLSRPLSLGSPEIAPFYTLLKDMQEKGLGTTTRHRLDLMLRSRPNQTRILSQTIWQTLAGTCKGSLSQSWNDSTRPQRNKHWRLDIPTSFSSFFGGSHVIALILKCSDQICKYLGVTGVRSICWDHVWHDS